MTFACERCGVAVEVAVKRTHRYCASCKVEAHREAKAREARKNADRIRATAKLWREANVERRRELERQRPPRSSRADYVRRWRHERWMDEHAAAAAPAWAAAALEVGRAWLALPAGPEVVERTGSTCAVACDAPRRLLAGLCVECGAGYVALVDRGDRCCSSFCAKRYGRRLHRERKRAAFVEPVFRRKVFERDGWRCQLCKKLVNKTAVVPHPRAPTIDHIVPTGKGGEHSMANVHTAHFMCNSQKGAQARDEQLRLVG